MAKYLVLIYGDEQRWDSMSPDEMNEIDEGHRALRAQAGTAVLASGQLESTSRAVTVRPGDADRSAITDGPFLETKEVLGGFYLLEAPDRETVVSLAGLLAETRHDHSAVEITPLVEHG
jgi:hypothetical protein